MTQPFFPCAISARSRNNEFLTIKTVVRKPHQNNGHTGSSCLDKAVLAQGGGGVQVGIKRAEVSSALFLAIRQTHLLPHHNSLTQTAPG